MIKKNLLKIVQDILNDMSSDEVTGIDDTVEAQQVASIVESTYYEMITNRNWPHTLKLIQLDTIADTSRPTHLRMPANLKELKSIGYDVRKTALAAPEYAEMKFLYPDEFIKKTNQYKTFTQVVEDFGGADFFIQTNRAPMYWTTFDDDYIVMDAYDSALEGTLQKSKTQCMAYLIPTFGKSNEYVPDLPAEAFPALIEEAKSTSFFVLKQMANQKAEQKATRQQRWLSRKAWRAQGGVRYENYGR